MEAIFTTSRPSLEPADVTTKMKSAPLLLNGTVPGFCHGLPTDDYDTPTVAGALIGRCRMANVTALRIKSQRATTVRLFDVLRDFCCGRPTRLITAKSEIFNCEKFWSFALPETVTQNDIGVLAGMGDQHIARHIVISAEGSFTWPHVDLNGSSVIHYLAAGGPKYWLILAPTEPNLSALNDFRRATDPNQDISSPEYLETLEALFHGRATRIVQEPGTSVFLPGGFVHGVWTRSRSASITCTWRRIEDLSPSSLVIRAARQLDDWSTDNEEDVEELKGLVESLLQKALQNPELLQTLPLNEMTEFQELEHFAHALEAQRCLPGPSVETTAGSGDEAQPGPSPTPISPRKRKRNPRWHENKAVWINNRYSKGGQ